MPARGVLDVATGFEEFGEEAGLGAAFGGEFLAAEDAARGGETAEGGDVGAAVEGALEPRLESVGVAGGKLGGLIDDEGGGGEIGDAGGEDAVLGNVDERAVGVALGEAK